MARRVLIVVGGGTAGADAGVFGVNNEGVSVREGVTTGSVVATPFVCVAEGVWTPLVLIVVLILGSSLLSLPV